MSNDLHRSIEAAKSLRLELARMMTGQDGAELSADDLQTLADTFDGETTLDAEIRNAVVAMDEDKIFIDGCKAREAELKARRQRLEKRVEATRGLIEQAMTIAGWPSLEMDIGTVTLGKASPRVEIDDESAIPTQFWKRQEPELDRAGLGKVLRERHKAESAIAKLRSAEEREAALRKLADEMPPIPGCHLETEGVSLTIRRS
jgi:hypothetical protein